MHNNRSKNGILQGEVFTPFTKESVAIRFVGSLEELLEIAHFLCLEPDDAQAAAMHQGRYDGGPLTLQGLHGGHATLQPVDQASDLLNMLKHHHHVGRG